METASLKSARVASRLARRNEILHQINDRYADTAAPSGLGQGRLNCWNGGQEKTQDLVTKAVPFGLEEISQFPTPSELRLRALFDLTHAEAKLAQSLARGDSLEEVAQRLCIKMTTARTQLAAIFAKTETRRQAKLVAILSRVAHLE